MILTHGKNGYNINYIVIKRVTILIIQRAKSAECEKEFPSKISNQISRFQKVLLTQTLRPDRLYSAIQLFSTEVLGSILINTKYFFYHLVNFRD